MMLFGLLRRKGKGHWPFTREAYERHQAFFRQRAQERMNHIACLDPRAEKSQCFMNCTVPPFGVCRARVAKALREAHVTYKTEDPGLANLVLAAAAEIERTARQETGDGNLPR